MPIPPPPTTYICPACGLSKTVFPRSDALMPGDFFHACPSCGHTSLDRKTVDLTSLSPGSLYDWIKRLWH